MAEQWECLRQSIKLCDMVNVTYFVLRVVEFRNLIVGTSSTLKRLKDEMG